MKKWKMFCFFLTLAPAAFSAGAAEGRVVLADGTYLVVQLSPEYLHRYTGARMYSFLPGGAREGDAVSGLENTWDRQTWIVNGEALTVGVEEYDMTAEETIDYFSGHTH